MAKIDYDATAILFGDSGWTYSGLREHLDQGDIVNVVARESNKSVFEFFRDYCVGAGNISVTTEYTGAVVIPAFGGPNMTHWKVVDSIGHDIAYPLRRELEPLVDIGDYVCLQPESKAHQKTSDVLRSINCKIRGYSIGVNGEYLVPGTEPFHSRSFSDVARLITHAVGVVTVFSSIGLHSFLLGHPRIISVSYAGISFKQGEEQTGHYRPRTILVNDGDHKLFYQTVHDHIGDVFST